MECGSVGIEGVGVVDGGVGGVQVRMVMGVQEGVEGPEGVDLSTAE